MAGLNSFIRKWLLTGAAVLFFEGNLPAQDTHPFKGRVIENDAYRTPLYGATVYFPGLQTGTTTTLNGYFSFNALPPGEHRLRVSFVGYKSVETTVRIPAGEEPVYRLNVDPQLLDEVEVLGEGGESMQVEQARLSTIKVTALPLTHLPKLMGEPDLIRIIQNLPGVKTESDFTGGFHVRGGRSDQNLILLDGVPIYNPWHLFGLFSAFNTEAIESVELTKGVFPAKYGSRVSSVLDIGLQQGSERLGAGYLTVSPLSGSFSYGRPLNQNTSYLISLRRTYMDPVFWILNRALKTENENTETSYSNGYNFYDLNLKLVHRMTPKLSLEAGYYRNNDRLDLKEEITWKDSNGRDIDHQRMSWKNNTGSLKLSYRASRLQSDTQAFLTFYNSDNLERYIWENEMVLHEEDNPPYVITENRDERGFEQQFRDIGIQQDLTFFPGRRNTIHLGGQWLLHRFRDVSAQRFIDEGFYIDPADIEDYRYGNIPASGTPPSEQLKKKATGDSLSVHAHEFGAYVSAGLQWGNVAFYPGVRYQGYTAAGTHTLLPRINVSWQVTPKWVVTAGYGHFAQYIHIVGLDLVRVPTERWFWSDEQRRPIYAEMAALGVGYDFGDQGSLSVEGYYKTTENLLNFNPQSQLEALENTDILPLFGSETLSGSGEAYGVEFFWEKHTGEVTGWLGYTLSWVWNQFDGLNNGNRFPARTDKRHDLQMSLNWDVAENWSLGALFNFKTGQPITFSTGHYRVEQDPLGIGDRVGSRSRDNWAVKKMNGFRLPAYHRLDLNLTWKNRRIFRRRAELSLNVVNVYNKVNPLMVLTSTESSDLPNGNIRVFPDNWYISQLPILPVLSMRIAFGGDAK